MVFDVNTRDSQGKDIFFNRYSLFIRGLGGFGGDKGPADQNRDLPPSRGPDVLHREVTFENQAAL